MTQYLTISRVAARYGTSADTIYRYLREGADFPLPDLDMPGGSKRWNIETLEAWEAARRP